VRCCSGISGDEPANGCGNCDNCLAPPSTVDATEAARKLLSAAFRTEMRFGISHLTEVLAGTDSEKIRSFGHHRLSVFGIADADELALMRPVARALLARDALRADEYGGSPSGRAPSRCSRAKRDWSWCCRPSARASSAAGRPPIPRAIPVRGAAGLPPRPRQAGRRAAYVVFHDSTLREMATLRPESPVRARPRAGCRAGEAGALWRGFRRGGAQLWLIFPGDGEVAREA
jgi:ATP-dependent DNA helicase RecQ